MALVTMRKINETITTFTFFSIAALKIDKRYSIAELVFLLPTKSHCVMIVMTLM